MYSQRFDATVIIYMLYIPCKVEEENIIEEYVLVIHILQSDWTLRITREDFSVFEQKVLMFEFLESRVLASLVM